MGGMPGQSANGLRSINQISLLSVNLKFNGRRLSRRPGRRDERADMRAGRNHAGRTIEVYDVLPPDPSIRRPTARPVRDYKHNPALVEDAVFEVVGPARPAYNDNPAPVETRRGVEPARLAAVAGVYLVNRLERLLSSLSPQSFATLIASLFFVAFWLFGGFAALAARSPSAPASPLSVERVFVEEQDANGMRLVAIGGYLRNVSDASIATPPLSVVREGGEVVGLLAPVTPELAAGQSVRFFGRFKLAGGKSGAISIFPAAR